MISILSISKFFVFTDLIKFVGRRHRKIGLANAIIKALEAKVVEKNYEKVYIHTDLSKPDVLRFWKNRSYSTFETERYVVHMIKDLA
ncbi:MAG: hypothetical protein KatS3mg085_228 [Candidatus Dojkabacteria bacterium]|nr:MAG: hypothetical protein KatS3mg085_228 [Candidatus Dojkabacteria bacterium]